MPIPSARVSRVMTWPRSKAWAHVALHVEHRHHLVPGEDRDRHPAAGRGHPGGRSRRPATRRGPGPSASRCSARPAHALGEGIAAPSPPAAGRGWPPRPPVKQARLGLRDHDGDHGVAEGLVDAPHRRLQDPLPREAARDLAEQGVDEGELLAALALGGEGHGVRHRDGELAREAGQVLEVVVGEGRRARLAGRVQHPEEHGRSALVVVVSQGDAEDARHRVGRAGRSLVGLGVVDQDRDAGPGPPGPRCPRPAGTSGLGSVRAPGLVGPGREEPQQRPPSRRSGRPRCGRRG